MQKIKNTKTGVISYKKNTEDLEKQKLLKRISDLEKRLQIIEDFINSTQKASVE